MVCDAVVSMGRGTLCFSQPVRSRRFVLAIKEKSSLSTSMSVMAWRGFMRNLSLSEGIAAFLMGE